MGESFVWDVRKEEINKRKHGLNFKIAMLAFKDPNRLIYKDRKHSSNEKRYFCIGKVEDQILTVRFTYRDDKIRIIGVGSWRKGVRYYEKEKD